LYRALGETCCITWRGWVERLNVDLVVFCVGIALGGQRGVAGLNVDMVVLQYNILMSENYGGRYWNQYIHGRRY
jgi:hypothetical protein